MFMWSFGGPIQGLLLGRTVLETASAASRCATSVARRGWSQTSWRRRCWRPGPKGSVFLQGLRAYPRGVRAPFKGVTGFL